jgi:hypothetical protein
VGGDNHELFPNKWLCTSGNFISPKKYFSGPLCLCLSESGFYARKEKDSRSLFFDNAIHRRHGHAAIHSRTSMRNGISAEKAARPFSTWHNSTQGTSSGSAACVTGSPLPASRHQRPDCQPAGQKPMPGSNG